MFATPAFAAQNINVQALQTSASLENLAVFTYGKALTLPFIANGNASILLFVLGMYPVPDTFQSTMLNTPTGARPATDAKLS